MKEWWLGDMLFDNLKNHKNDSWSKKKQQRTKLAEKKNIGEKKNRKKKKKQAEKAKSSLNQKAKAKSQ